MFFGASVRVCLPFGLWLKLARSLCRSASVRRKYTGLPFFLISEFLPSLKLKRLKPPSQAPKPWRFSPVVLRSSPPLPLSFFQKRKKNLIPGKIWKRILEFLGQISLFLCSAHFKICSKQLQESCRSFGPQQHRRS